MPSDFISLFNGDLDLNSPRSLYSKESVYDLLPRELQLPPSTQQTPEVMSQTSGGEAGRLPSAPLGSDAMSSSLTMEGPRSAFSTLSSSTMHSSTSACDLNPAHNRNVDPEDTRNSRVVPEIVGAEGGSGNNSSAANGRGNGELVGGRAATSQDAPTHHQMTPSKRRTILNISPPPQDLFDDSRMSCQDDTPLDSEQSSSIWVDDSQSNFSIMSTSSYNDNTEVPRKSRKRTPRQRPGPKTVPAAGASMDVFDAGSAKGPHFVLSQLGHDSKTGPKGSSDDPHTPNQKGGTLMMQFPQKCEGKELKILVQPETQHRARYLTEGSRGSVKDRTQQSFPTVKLEGVSEPVVLQVFVGNDAGRVKPHGFYQACRVTGRNTTACKEVDIDGTTVIEVSLDPSTKMTLAVDCVGILKLRNADVEARIGVAGSKKKSTRARLVFRVNIPRSDGSVLTLQTPSSPILCTQPAGVPEILKKSLHSCPVRGGEEVFIIGKNFLKDTKVIFHENISDEKSWKAEAEIDMELFHQNHLIVKAPPYQNQAITSAVCVGIYVVTNAGRSHDVQTFTYTPDPVKNDVPVKKEMPSPVKTCSFDEQIKVVDSALMPSMLPLVKREDVTPMEVTSNLQSSGVFKAAGDPDKGQAAAFTNSEPLSTIQKQDISVGSSFSLPADSMLPQGTQQFLLEPRDSLRQERPGSSSAGSQQNQPHLSLFPPDEVAQLEEAVRQLKAKGFCNLPLQSDNSIAKQQQQHIQHQQQIQNQQIQQQQQQQQQIQQQQLQQQQQQQQQQIQQQQLQQQQQQQQIQQQQQQVLENLQQQLFQSQIQMQCGIFQEASQGKNAEHQGSPQGVVTNQGTLFQQDQQQQQQNQQQQQAALFQQANELCSMQTNFLQQTPTHSSPPIFHSPSPLAETQDPQGALFQKASQEQVQAALFQNTMTVLPSPEQQPSTPGLFLPQPSLPTQLSTSGSQQQQQQQQQQLAFLSALQSAQPEQQSVFQPQAQMSPIQQRSPMEQQQPSQPQTHTQQVQQASLFQTISPHSSPSTLSPGQQQQQQPGLLFCSNNLSTQPQASNLLFTSQGQMPPLTSSSLVSQEPQNPSLLFSQASVVAVNQQNRPEPMAIGNPTDPQQQVMFQEQQHMQLGGTTNNRQEQPVGLFMPQSNMASLQGGMAAQELAQSAMFASQNGVSNLQTTTSSPVQQSGTLFQNAVSGNISQPNQPQQPGLFIFGMQNECGQMMNAPGNTLSDQIIAISQSGQNARESEACIQSLLSQSMSQSGTVQGNMSASQNMEKIDDLLVSLQESGSNLTRSY
ncbi:nuclear factor of activated T-cells 5 isoform X2 [Leuresthes tenuis]|uniref:nuclear factor of activated T-cells 5 isoform X2 n=1 Tax=Leuresthes tenuis TaxID=355514 RepID=UPI003B502D41